MKTSLFTALILAALIAVLAGCNKGTDTTTEPAPGTLKAAPPSAGAPGK